jgi:hypothetical protein
MYGPMFLLALLQWLPSITYSNFHLVIKSTLVLSLLLLSFTLLLLPPKLPKQSLSLRSWLSR